MNETEELNQFLNGRVKVLVGNLVHQEVDAIVNAANSTLLGGGGVDGAIHSAGGLRILEECREIRNTRYPKGLPTGEAVITTGGNLRAKHIIHTVGPIYSRAGDNARLLANCYRNSLTLAVENNLKTIAFPAISTGAFGYPRDEAAEVSSEAIREFLLTDDQLTEVRLVFFAPSDANVLLKNHVFNSNG